MPFGRFHCLSSVHRHCMISCEPIQDKMYRQASKEEGMVVDATDVGMNTDSPYACRVFVP